MLRCWIHSFNLLSRKGYLEVNQPCKDLPLASSLLTWGGKQARMHTRELVFSFYTARFKLQPICYKQNLSIHNPMNLRIRDRWKVIMGDRMLTKPRIAFLCPCHSSERSVPVLTGAAYHSGDMGTQDHERIQIKGSRGLSDSPNPSWRDCY